MLGRDAQKPRQEWKKKREGDRETEAKRDKERDSYLYSQYRGSKCWAGRRRSPDRSGRRREREKERQKEREIEKQGQREGRERFLLVFPVQGE